MNVRLFKPSVGEEELANVRDVFDRAWLGLGPLVRRFEAEWTEYLGAKASVGLNSGTAALQLALAAFHFPAGKKILVPAMTFISTAVVALHQRLDVVFVDADPGTLGLDLEDLERKIDKDCAAVIPVHFGGQPVPMEPLMEIARDHNLKVIEDCAHCAGGSYHGRKLGTWGDIGCFSFEEKKAMTTGDGGMLSAGDPDLLEPLRAIRWVGIDKDTWRRVRGYTAGDDEDARHWYYEIATAGFKYNMNDLMAAIGLAQLKKLDRMNARRAQIIRRYIAGLADCPYVEPLLPYDNLEHGAYWLFGVRSEHRDELIVHLKHHGIATSVHYTPLTLHPLFADHKEAVPHTLELYDRILTLPLYADMTDEECDYVVEAIREFRPR